MAQKFLDYAGLARYDALIKALIKSGDQELLVMINDLKELVEGSDSESVDDRIAAVKAALDDRIAELEAKHDTDIADAKKYTDDSIAALVDGAPETLDTLKEIAEWIGSDEAGVANLISEVAANKAAIAANKASIDADVEELAEHISAASNSFANHEDRLKVVEELVGAASSSESEGETLVERVDALEAISHDEPGAIADSDIDALFA